MVGALDPVRDMNYVSDTVAAFLGVGAADGVEGELFNVGSGVGRTVADMLAAIQRVAGVDKPVEQAEARLRPEKSEVTALVCDYAEGESRVRLRASRRVRGRAREAPRLHRRAGSAVPTSAVYHV